MEKSVLEVKVTDQVQVRDFTAPGAVEYPTPSPFYQPEFVFSMEEGEGMPGSPRGPTVTIDFGLFEAAGQ